MISGSLGGFVPFLVRVEAAPHLSAGLMALIICTTPIMAAIVVTLTRTGQVTTSKLLGIVLGLAAAAVILLPRATLPDRGEIFWTGFLFLIPLSYALVQVFVLRFWPVGLGPEQVALGDNSMMVLCYLPAYWIMGDPSELLREWHAGTLAIVAWSAVAATSSLLFYWLIRLTTPVFVSSGTFVAIFSGFLWGWLFFAERLGVDMIVSAVMFCIAMGLIFYERRVARA